MLAFLPFLAALTFCSRPIQSQDALFSSEIAAFREADRVRLPEKGQVVFIGSSSFTRWTNLSQAFPGYQVLNRAFGGSRLIDVTARLDDVVFPYEPRQVVIYCGENDFALDDHLNPDQVVDRFMVLFTKIRSKLPLTSIGYVSMKPSPSRWNLAPKFRAANAAIKHFLNGKAKTAFVDVWPVMLGQNGEPKPEIFVDDKLHLNEAGYRLWAPLISQILTKPKTDRMSLSSPEGD